MTNDEIWLYTLCKKNGLIITDIQIRQLTLFKQALLDWNGKINLISRKDEENLWKGHISLSIALLFKVEFRGTMNVLDLGTGGGFPGIPLSIMHPDCSFLLLDSTQKKIAAVQSMVESIGLSNVKTIWGRAEELQKRPGLHHSFDLIVVRSVSNLANLFAWGLPFLKEQNGKNIINEKIRIATPSLITFKGSEIEDEEIKAKTEFPNVMIQSIPLIFNGSEEFEKLDKKLIIATKQ